MASVLVHSDRRLAVKCIVKGDNTGRLRGCVTKACRRYSYLYVLTDQGCERTAIIVHKRVGILGIPSIETSEILTTDVTEPSKCNATNGNLMQDMDWQSRKKKLNLDIQMKKSF